MCANTCRNNTGTWEKETEVATATTWTLTVYRQSDKIMKAECGSFLMGLRKYLYPSHSQTMEWIQGHSVQFPSPYKLRALIQEHRSTRSWEQGYERELRWHPSNTTRGLRDTMTKEETKQNKDPHLWSQNINKLIFRGKKKGDWIAFGRSNFL